MKVRIWGVGAVASLVLGVFMVSGAQAGHTWKVNGSKLAAGASETCKAIADGTMTLKGEVLKEEFHLTSTTIETAGCKITQVGSGATAEAVGSIEKLSLGGLTVDKPTGCKVNSPINTNSLTFHVVTPVAGIAKLTFNPTASTNGTWGNIVVVNCPYAETYPLKGQACIEMPQAGVFAMEQTFKFSAAAEEACSGDRFTIGLGPAIMRGAFVLKLTVSIPWGFEAT